MRDFAPLRNKTLREPLRSLRIRLGNLSRGMDYRSKATRKTCFGELIKNGRRRGWKNTFSSSSSSPPAIQSWSESASAQSSLDNPRNIIYLPQKKRENLLCAK